MVLACRPPLQEECSGLNASAEPWIDVFRIYTRLLPEHRRPLLRWLFTVTSYNEKFPIHFPVYV